MEVIIKPCRLLQVEDADKFVVLLSETLTV